MKKDGGADPRGQDKSIDDVSCGSIARRIKCLTVSAPGKETLALRSVARRRPRRATTDVPQQADARGPVLASAMEQLKERDISRTRVADLAPLANARRLRLLQASSNEIADIASGTRRHRTALIRASVSAANGPRASSGNGWTELTLISHKTYVSSPSAPFGP